MIVTHAWKEKFTNYFRTAMHFKPKAFRCINCFPKITDALNKFIFIYVASLDSGGILLTHATSSQLGLNPEIVQEFSTS